MARSCPVDRRAAASDGHGDGVVALGLDRRGQTPVPPRPRCPVAAATKVTSAWRSVRVPVLSKTTPSTLARRSSTSPLRMKMPTAAARPQPTIMATGAARPMAHGQATSSTASAAQHRLAQVADDQPPGQEGDSGARGGRPGRRRC